MKNYKQRIILYGSMILCFFYAVSVRADDLSVPNSSAIETAANSPEWLALVHYRKNLWGGYKSSIDSDNFFLSKGGKTNPVAEIRATIKLFDNQTGDETRKKQCLFPARWQYLKKQNLIQSSFPDCDEYEQFKKDLNPAGVTLLYTDAYMNNPSSLFGHTLMRIDIPEGRTQLVSHGVNYGAYVDENTAGLLYAVYGLTGGYYGGFTVKPYYQIINMYNNLENRDIWEYGLNLTADERDMLVAHLWEVGHTQTRYYFFTKNCSYLLTEVLDAVRPSLRLADDFPRQTIPLDTVKSVNKRSDFVKTTRYRPSRQRRIAYRYDKMNSAEKKALISYLHTGDIKVIAALSEQSQVDILDAAYEYIQYQWIKNDIALKDYRKKSFQVLKTRRNIQLVSPEPVIDGDNPIGAHDSMRVSFAVGTNRGKVFEELGWRAAYHSLTENPTGLLRGAEINFLDTVFRYKPQKQTVKLQKLGLVKISSMAPYNALFHPVSYQIDTGVERKRDSKNNKEKLVYNLRGGSGLTFQPFQNLYTYGLVNTTAQYGGGFYPHRFGIALGFSGGLVYYMPQVQTQVEFVRDFSDNRMMNRTMIDGTINYSVVENWNIGINYRFENQKYHSDNTVKVVVNRYF